MREVDVKHVFAVRIISGIFAVAACSIVSADMPCRGMTVDAGFAAESGTDTQMTLAGDWSVGRDDELPLPYDAVVSASTTPIDGETVLQVTFVIDWRD